MKLNRSYFRFWRGALFRWSYYRGRGRSAWRYAVSMGRWAPLLFLALSAQAQVQVTLVNTTSAPVTANLLIENTWNNPETYFYGNTTVAVVPAYSSVTRTFAPIPEGQFAGVHVQFRDITGATVVGNVDFGQVNAGSALLTAYHDPGWSFGQIGRIWEPAAGGGGSSENQEDNLAAWWLGFVLGAMARIFKAGLRWFRRSGDEGLGS